eukprot:1023325-Prorocentrum_minimum.AAC.3
MRRIFLSSPQAVKGKSAAVLAEFSREVDVLGDAEWTLQGHCRARRAQGSCGNVAGGEGQERGGAGGVFAGGGLVQGALRRDECGGQGDGAELQEGLCRVRGVRGRALPPLQAARKEA